MRFLFCRNDCEAEASDNNRVDAYELTVYDVGHAF